MTMAKKSWHLNRRDLLKGTGIALALPSLNAMRPTSTRANAAAQATPKRMMIGYIAYGTYMPDGPAGLPKQDKSDQRQCMACTRNHRCTIRCLWVLSGVRL